jgi:hypothetical protein
VPQSQSHVQVANDVVNALGRLARLVDEDYHEACLDTSMTNRPPVCDREALVSLFEGAAHVANFLTDPDSWGDFDEEPGVRVPWGYLTGHGWGLPPRTGLPEGWRALPARRLVGFLTTQDPQQPGATNRRDREQVLEELDRRDRAGLEGP